MQLSKELKALKPFHPNVHHRRSIRLDGFDYSEVGLYFITICTSGRQCMFGHVADGTITLSDYGQIVEAEWLKTASLRRNVELDGFIIMPNHFHSILIIKDLPQESNRPVGARRALPTGDLAANAQIAKSGKLMPATVGAIVGNFKSSVTREINRRRRTEGATVWQRNYYEKIIRNEQMLNAIRQYIEANPTNWVNDEYYSG